MLTLIIERGCIMNHEEQVAAVKKALDLETTIDIRTHEVAIIQNQKFRAAPTPPIRRTVERKMPEIEDGVKFNFIVGLLLIIFLLPLGVIYYFYYKKKKKDTRAAIENSAEYKQKCAEANKKYDRIQAEYDAEYAKNVDEFNNNILPAYNAERDKWEKERQADLNNTKALLEKATNELKEHYNTTRIIPSQYRKIPALQYVYDMISTSEYDIRSAIENYDKKVQRDLEEERIREQQITNQLTADQNALLNDQNDLLNEQNEISERARRDANIASIVGAVQRHKTNSILKDFSKK